MKKLDYLKWWGNQVVFLISAVLFFIVSVWFIKNLYFQHFASEVARVQYYISGDIQKIIKLKKWSPQFLNLSEVKFETQTPGFRSWVGKLRLPLTIINEGKNHLVVTITGHGQPDSSKEGILVHYSMIRNSDNELLWQFVRVYKIY